jgi:hypothetical protein
MLSSLYGRLKSEIVWGLTLFKNCPTVKLAYLSTERGTVWELFPLCGVEEFAAVAGKDCVNDTDNLIKVAS